MVLHIGSNGRHYGLSLEHGRWDRSRHDRVDHLGGAHGGLDLGDGEARARDGARPREVALHDVGRPTTGEGAARAVRPLRGDVSSDVGGRLGRHLVFGGEMRAEILDAAGGECTAVDGAGEGALMDHPLVE